MTPLYFVHDRALMTVYSDLEAVAVNQTSAFVGTPGAIVRKENASGFLFYAHQTYDGNGTQRDAYVGGPVGDPSVEAATAALRGRIAEVNRNLKSIRLLVREGFAAVDRKTHATIASLHNHAVFRAGGILVGSHAYGALLNKLGARAVPYTTEDIDIARRRKLAFSVLPETPLLEMLRQSGIDFVEVPQLDPRVPSSSFKEPGRSQFTVDLLVPSPTREIAVVPVPELNAHATALPYLDYLLAETQRGVVISRQGYCAVQLPLPERFAIHKLIVSQLRSDRGAKSAKDIHQASVLSAVLAETFPGAIVDALAATPTDARTLLDAGIAASERYLSADYPRAWAELRSVSPA